MNAKNSMFYYGQEQNEDNLLRGLGSILLFLIFTVSIKVIPNLSSSLIKCVLFMTTLVISFRKDEFSLLLFPVAVFEPVWGTLISGRVGALSIYLLLLIFKLVIIKVKYIVRSSETIIVAILVAYCSFATFISSDSEWMRIGLYLLLFFVCYGQGLIDKRKAVYVIFLTGLVVAISMCFAINGYSAFTEGDIKGYRVNGLGFSDPNYSSYVCVLALCSALNLPKVKFRKLWMVFSILFIFLGVIRSGSRAGILGLAICFFIKVLITKDLAKKYTYISGGLVAVLVIFTYLLPKVEYSYVILERIKTITSFTFSDANGDISNGRNSLVVQYLKYFIFQHPFKIFFGGNVLQSTSLLRMVGTNSATHNTILDFLCAFGLFGTLFSGGVYFIKSLGYFRERSSIGDAIFMLKLCTVFFGITLSFVYRIPFWFVFFL